MVKGNERHLISAGVAGFDGPVDEPDDLCYPSVSWVVLSFLFVARKFFVKAVAWAMLNLSLLFMGMSLTDPDFAAIVTKPDNVPIVGMISPVGLFHLVGAPTKLSRTMSGPSKVWSRWKSWTTRRCWCGPIWFTPN
ncbi:MAG: hypothetical protein R3C99_17785 [Pirellulaceae bacterium]